MILSTIVGQGIVAEGKDKECRSRAFPAVCVLPGGSWLCAFRAAPTKAGTVGQHVLITHSEDEGRSWSVPISPFAPPSIGGISGLFRACGLTSLGGDDVLAALCWVDNSEPELPFFNEETEGLLDSRIFLSHSNDSGKSWSAPKLMDTSPFDVPTPITGPVMVLPSGEWACQFELNKHYLDTSEWRHSSLLMFSRDEGRTWPDHSIVTGDPRIFYWDQRPAVMSDGQVLDLFWTFNRRDAVYLNIHARESKDGRTWSEIWDTGVPGQPAQPVQLPDVRIAMVYVDRTGEPIIKLRISDDGGHTWPEETETIIHRSFQNQTQNKGSMQDAWTEMARFSIGLPATALLASGDVLVVYYAGPNTDDTDICWARVRCK